MNLLAVVVVSINSRYIYICSSLIVLSTSKSDYFCIKMKIILSNLALVCVPSLMRHLPRYAMLSLQPLSNEKVHNQLYMLHGLLLFYNKKMLNQWFHVSIAVVVNV